MVETTIELSSLVNEKYVPTSIERKRAVLMYFLVWILVSLSSKKLWNYELFHLKQSCWWWVMFFIIIVITAFLFFVPFVRLLPILLYIAMLVIWVLFIKQAWEWYYLWNNEKVLLPLFIWLWAWILDIFEIEDLSKESTVEEIDDIE